MDDETILQAENYARLNPAMLCNVLVNLPGNIVCKGAVSAHNMFMQLSTKLSKLHVSKKSVVVKKHSIFLYRDLLHFFTAAFL